MKFSQLAAGRGDLKKSLHDLSIHTMNIAHSYACCHPYTTGTYKEFHRVLFRGTADVDYSSFPVLDHGDYSHEESQRANAWLIKRSLIVGCVFNARGRTT